MTAALPVPNTTAPAVCLWTIGGGGRDPARRCVSTDFGGWQWQADRMRRAADLGYPRRHCMSNPFGLLPGQDMQLDQFVEAQAAGLSWLTVGFASALRPVTDQMEVIGYLGTESNDPDFLKLRRGRWAADDFLRLLALSIGVLQDAGCSIAWDASFAARRGSVEFEATMLAHALAVEGGSGLPYQRRADYHEPPALLSAPEWWDKPGIITESLYRVRNPSWHPDLSRISGEYIRQMNVPPAKYTTTDPATGAQTHDWSRTAYFIPDFVRECRALGQTPMVDFSWFVSQGVPFSELMKGTDVAATATT